MISAGIPLSLISARYERGSIILTSNKSTANGARSSAIPIIATAILDGLLHHSTTVNIRGESYRLKERRKAGLIPLPEQQQADTAAAAPSGRGKRNDSPEKYFLPMKTFACDRFHLTRPARPEPG